MAIIANKGVLRVQANTFTDGISHCKGMVKNMFGILNMALLLLFVLFLVFASIKTELFGRIHNLEVETTVKITFLYILPFKITFFNMADNPLAFKYRLFGKTKDIKRLAQEKVVKKTIKGVEKRKGRRIREGMKFILSKTRHIKEMVFIGHLGIKERADTTALVTGCLNSLLIPLPKICGIKNARTYFIPEYNMDVLHIDYKCIICFSVANIIHEGIRYYFKRRK